MENRILREKVITTIESKSKAGKLLGNVQCRLFEDLGFDSMALLDLIESIQLNCGVEFLPEDYTFDRFDTVASVISLVEERHYTK